MDNPSMAIEEGEHMPDLHTPMSYWGNDDATNETLKTGRWLAMGDIGKIWTWEAIYQFREET